MTGRMEKLGYPKRVDGLDISQAEEGYIVYQPDKDRVHFLNHTAILILELCNGESSPDEIAELVKTAYGLPEAPRREVEDALEKMKAEGLFVV